MSTETDTHVVAEVRENFGKGYARRLRAAGQIPAVIYGHGTDPVHVSLPGHQVSLLIRRANVVLELDVAGTQQRRDMLGFGAAQQGAHARQQLHDAKGLGQVIVGARIQPAHLVHLGALGGNQYHGQALGARVAAQALQ